mmetsp:Transcript_106589/g.308416  ORF Transcript_106589/g.308416 Transcript_106589/m.308416 type:complete len:347 (+) Transcript_106589:415-1455(+)
MIRRRTLPCRATRGLRAGREERPLGAARASPTGTERLPRSATSGSTPACTCARAAASAGRCPCTPCGACWAAPGSTTASWRGSWSSPASLEGITPTSRSSSWRCTSCAVRTATQRPCCTCRHMRPLTSWRPCAGRCALFRTWRLRAPRVQRVRAGVDRERQALEMCHRIGTAGSMRAPSSGLSAPSAGTRQRATRSARSSNVRASGRRRAPESSISWTPEAAGRGSHSRISSPRCTSCGTPARASHCRRPAMACRRSCATSSRGSATALRTWLRRATRGQQAPAAVRVSAAAADGKARGLATPRATAAAPTMAATKTRWAVSLAKAGSVSMAVAAASPRPAIGVQG